MSRLRNHAINSAAGGITPSYVGEITTGPPGDYRTRLDIITTLGAIAGGAALGLGKLIYTFPAGEISVGESTIDMAIKQTQAHINADTPVVGLGTVVATGAVSVLSGTATFQNVLAGATAADANGTATRSTVTTKLVIAAAGAHTLYLNAAASWAASGDAAALLRGTVWFYWRHTATT